MDVLKLDAEFFRGEDNEGRGDLIQGYYFAKPMPVEDFEQVVFEE